MDCDAASYPIFPKPDALSTAIAVTARGNIIPRPSSGHESRPKRELVNGGSNAEQAKTACPVRLLRGDGFGHSRRGLRAIRRASGFDVPVFPRPMRQVQFA